MIYYIKKFFRKTGEIFDGICKLLVISLFLIYFFLMTMICVLFALLPYIIVCLIFYCLWRVIVYGVLI